VKTLVSNVSVAPIFVDFLNTFIQKVKTQESMVSVAPKFYTKKYSRAIWLRECFAVFANLQIE
jgi:hypothetical protein